jgi:hypothetical protein
LGPGSMMQDLRTNPSPKRSPFFLCTDFRTWMCLSNSFGTWIYCAGTEDKIQVSKEVPYFFVRILGLGFVHHFFFDLDLWRRNWTQIQVSK